MTIIQKISVFFKKKLVFLSYLDTKTLRIQKFNPFFFISFVIIFSIIFFLSSNLVNKKSKQNENNLKEITKTNEFFELTNFFISRINSSYEEKNYIIKSNDTVKSIKEL